MKLFNNNKYKPMYYKGNPTNYLINKKGHVISKNYKNLGKQKKMKQFNHKGYLAVNLTIDGKYHRVLVHRLVAENFIGLPDNHEKLEVNHKDGNKKNNKVKNLEWSTHQNNMKHAIKNKLRVYTSEQKSDISKKQAKKICKLLERNDMSMDQIAETVGTTYGVVYNIKYGNTWKDVSDKYNVSKHNKRKDRSKQSGKKIIHRLDESEVISIADDLMNLDLSINDIAKKHNINKSKVESIRYKYAWAKVTSDYDFSIRDTYNPRKKYGGD